jgi:hypothetical protein
MRRTRVNNEFRLIKESAYDFYNMNDGKNMAEKILNYYLEKIRKYGQDSLTNAETEIFNDAKKGKVPVDKPIYKKNKVTGDIEIGPDGKPVRLDKDSLVPGVPFITAKGRGKKKQQTIDGRCYWNINDPDSPGKVYYVYDRMSIEETNPNGLIVWKSVAKSGKSTGAFMNLTSSEANARPADLWNTLNKKYDKGAILDKETYIKFIEFDKLYHGQEKKMNSEKIDELVEFLKNYPKK